MDSHQKKVCRDTLAKQVMEISLENAKGFTEPILHQIPI